MEPATDLRRFVIIATPRCGSNWLCTLLDSHPDILCHHELFNPEGIRVSQTYHREGRSLGSLKLRDEAPLDLLDLAWRKSTGYRAAGFKINIGQPEVVFDEILSDTRLLKIVIRRRNRIRTFVSERVAEINGAWESYDYSEKADSPLPLVIAREELQDHVARNKAFYRGICERLERSGQSWLEMEYEQLTSAEQRRALLNYLDVDLEQPLSATTRKVNKGSLESMISNYSELKNSLQGSELEPDLDANDYD